MTSWYQALGTLVSSIESMITSLYMAEAPRTFVVMSKYYHNDSSNIDYLTFDCSGQINPGGGLTSAWIPLSSTPFGTYVGSFTVRSGPVLLTTEILYTFQMTPLSGVPNKVFFRGIINPGSIDLYGNSVFAGYHVFPGIAPGSVCQVDPFLSNVTPVSLAPGKYNLTMHVKATPGGVGNFASFGFMNQQDSQAVVTGTRVVVTGRDTRP